MLSRFALAGISIGCDDAEIWLKHGKLILEHGLRYAYDSPPDGALYFNHPPLAGYWAMLAAYLSKLDAYRFSLWMKVPGLLGDVLAVWLIVRIAAKRGTDAAVWAFAAFGLSLLAILMSGYHGNTDSACAALTLLAAYLFEERRRPGAAGFALGAALNVKLMPLFLVPALLSRCRSLKDVRAYLVGLSLAGLPFVPFLATSAHEMYIKLVRYNSQQLPWGIVAFLKQAALLPAYEPHATRIRALYAVEGRYVILAAVALVSLVNAVVRRDRPYELPAIAWAIFLVLTPGFGIQYTVCVLPLLFAADLRRAIIYSLNAGCMLLLVYTARMEWTLPLHGRVQYWPFHPVAILFGIIAWATLVGFLVSRLPRIVGLRSSGEPCLPS